MADQRKDKRISIYRVANLCVVLILSSSILCIARLLLVKGAVSSTIAPGIYISVGLVSHRASAWLLLIPSVDPHHHCSEHSMLPYLPPATASPNHITFSRSPAARFGLCHHCSVFDALMDAVGGLRSASSGIQSAHLPIRTLTTMEE